MSAFPNGGGLPPDFSQQNISACCVGLGQPGDQDGDGDVDQDDFGSFEVCASGRGVPQNDPVCARARLDNDEDVDQVDFSVRQRCFSGEDVPGSATCND